MRYLGLLFFFLLAACAGTGSSSDGRVTVVTAENNQEFDGADCTVHNKAKNWHIVTPATLEIGTANGELRVVCNKTGYRTSEVRLPPIGQSQSSLGIGLGSVGGNVGGGVGLSLPIKIGGGHYPSRITVNMNRQ